MSQADTNVQFGGYTLLERIAAGGMAEIFRAKSVGLGGFEKILAIKRLHPEYSLDDQFVKMLVDEAKITVLLQHPNVVQIYDLGRAEEMYYIAMEFVEGPDLFRLLQVLHDTEKPISLATACFILAEICNGLHYAHFRTHPVDEHPLKIIHRDVSPQNILLSWAGEVKIGDFGIAKAVERLTRTEAGVIKGKFYYMSPEQAKGEEIDFRSDIFSAGILLFETLTATPLYEDPGTESVINLVRNAAVRSPRTERPDIPKELESIVMKALQKDPQARFKDAREMARALQQFVADRIGLYTRADFSKTLRELFRNAPSLVGATGRSPVFTPPHSTIAGNQLATPAHPQKKMVATRLETPRPVKEASDTDPDQARFDANSDTQIHALKDEALEPHASDSDSNTAALNADRTPTRSEGYDSPDIREAASSLVNTADEIEQDDHAMRLALVRRLPPLEHRAQHRRSIARRRREKVLKIALTVVALAIIAVTVVILYILATWTDMGPNNNPESAANRAEAQDTPIRIDQPDRVPKITTTPAPTAVKKTLTKANQTEEDPGKNTAASTPSPPPQNGQILVTTQRDSARYKVYVDGQLTPHGDKGRITVSVGRHLIHFLLFPEGSKTPVREVVIAPNKTFQIEL